MPNVWHLKICKMELTKSHREALLNELEKANSDLELQKLLLKKEQTKTTGLLEWFEISEFLAQQRICLIKKAISENDIDY